MKQLITIFTAVVFFITGYLVGNQNSTESGLVNFKEARFVTYSQQANYKLAALKNIKEGKVDEAVAILTASLVVDESEMSYCGIESNKCAAESKAVLKGYESKKLEYDSSFSNQ